MPGAPLSPIAASFESLGWGLGKALSPRVTLFPADVLMSLGAVSVLAAGMSPHLLQG